MAVRKIIKIDEERCNGCGLCVPNCAEGALQIINGKAKVVKDSYCDGLGACLGHCPQDALEIIEREADDFNEEEAMEFVRNLKQKDQKHAVHHEHAGHHGGHHNHHGHMHGQGGCPGSRMRVLNNEAGNDGAKSTINAGDVEIRIKSQLRQWPVQLNLVPVNAPYFDNADLLVTADCVPFAYPNYHLDLLKGKIVLIGCPKLDDIEYYKEKLTQIISSNNIKSITVAHMEVPCCSGIVRAVDAAMAGANKNIPVNRVRIGIDGSSEKW